jgi:hypothetical protein
VNTNRKRRKLESELIDVDNKCTRKIGDQRRMITRLKSQLATTRNDDQILLNGLQHELVVAQTQLVATQTELRTSRLQRCRERQHYETVTTRRVTRLQQEIEVLVERDPNVVVGTFSMKCRGRLHARRDYDTIMVPCFCCAKSIDSRVCPIGRLDQSRPNFYCGACNLDMIVVVPSTMMTQKRIARWDSHHVDRSHGACVTGSHGCTNILFVFDAWHWCHTISRAHGGSDNLANGVPGCPTCNSATKTTNSIDAAVSFM